MACRTCTGTSLCSVCAALLARSQPRVVLPQAAQEELERSFQGRLLRDARRLGYLAYHDWDSRGNAPGFLDTWLAKPGYPLFALELKVGREKATMEQQQWLGVLPLTTGIVTGVYYPRDYDVLLALLTRRVT